MSIPSQAHHDMLPRPSHDEDGRQAFMLSFRELLVNETGPGVYDPEIRIERVELRENALQAEPDDGQPKGYLQGFMKAPTLIAAK